MYERNFIIKFSSSAFTVPPKPPVISDANGRKMTEKLGPLREGEDLVATCATSGGEWVGVKVSAFVVM